MAPVDAHPSQSELLRLADEGLSGSGAEIIAHVCECRACAEVVRYARAIQTALRASLDAEALPEAVLRRIIETVTHSASDS